MKYIKSYKTFESVGEAFYWEQKTKKQKMGTLLHLYGSIPVSKAKAEDTIKKIVLSTQSKFYRLDSDTSITPGWDKLHDKLRFSDYFDSLLSGKETRGHNFEGMITGLFDGMLTTPGDRADVIIDGKKYSVKFLDDKGESPVLGSIKGTISNNNKLLTKVTSFIDSIPEVIKRIPSVIKLFKSSNNKLKQEVFDISFIDVDGFIIAYPDNSDIKNTTKIILHVLTKEQMRKVICSGEVNVPKSATDDWSLRASSNTGPNSYKSNSHKIDIIIPTITEEELDTIMNLDDNKWATEVFGNRISKRMRPDVVKDLRDSSNRPEIANKLKDIK